MSIGFSGHLDSYGAESGTGRVLSGPCQTWTDGDLIRNTACFDEEIKRDYDLEQWARFATVTLWRLAGRQARFKGLCVKVMRPEPHQCTTMPYGDSWPAGLARPSLKRYSTVRLLDAPVYDVTRVVIEGFELDEDAYRLVAYRDLIRVDGDAWPTRQELARKASVPPEGDSDSRVGTWQVEYRVGQEVQEDARVAATVFAAELAMARCGSTKCRLPQRYWQKRIDPMAFINDGKVGIPEVDAWLHSVNPQGIARRAKVSNLRDVAARRRGGVLS